MLTLLVLSACGFTPMYSGKEFNVYVAPIVGTNGIDLRNALNAKLNSKNDLSAEYALDVKLSNPVTRYKAIETTGDATWQEVILDANYTLSRNGVEILTGTERGTASYSFVEYLPAATAAYNSAVQNSLIELSDKIGMRAIAELNK